VHVVSAVAALFTAVVEPDNVVYLPLAAFTHAVSPAVPANFPTPQSEQAVEPAAPENLPAGHSVCPVDALVVKLPPIDGAEPASALTQTVKPEDAAYLPDGQAVAACFASANLPGGAIVQIVAPVALKVPSTQLTCLTAAVFTALSEASAAYLPAVA